MKAWLVSAAKREAAPYLVATATAVSSSTTSGAARVPMARSLTSRASMRLPRNSGVRPTISPARNTASRARSSGEHREEEGDLDGGARHR